MCSTIETQRWRSATHWVRVTRRPFRSWSTTRKADSSPAALDRLTAGILRPGRPVGSCADDPSGRASFGFVAKYKKGAAEPDGETEFMFQARNLWFHSTSYDWLVVSGQDRAQFKGTGSVNGQDGYRFLLTAHDGGGTAPDGYRTISRPFGDARSREPRPRGTGAPLDSQGHADG